MPEKSNSTLRTILIGVVTTVLATTVVYLLGFQNSNKKERKLRNEATVKAWKTYRQNLDIFSAVLKKMDDGSPDIEKKRQDINHEIATTQTSFENIKKEPNIDSRLITLIDIKSAQLEGLKGVINGFLNRMTDFAALEPTEEEGMHFLSLEAIQLKKDVSELKKRDSIRVATLSAELKKEYKLRED